MPLYEYRCESCGEVFEILQQFSDPPLEVHDGCGGRLERLLSPPALLFKGTGWYVTDYARKSSSSESSGKKEGSGDSSSKESSAKAESKGTD